MPNSGGGVGLYGNSNSPNPCGCDNGLAVGCSAFTGNPTPGFPYGFYNNVLLTLVSQSPTTLVFSFPYPDPSGQVTGSIAIFTCTI